MVGALEDLRKRKEDTSEVVGVLENAWEWNEDIWSWFVYWKMCGDERRTFRVWLVHRRMCGKERRTFRGWLVHWRMHGNGMRPFWS